LLERPWWAFFRGFYLPEFSNFFRGVEMKKLEKQLRTIKKDIKELYGVDCWLVDCNLKLWGTEDEAKAVFEAYVDAKTKEQAEQFPRTYDGKGEESSHFTKTVDVRGVEVKLTFFYKEAQNG